MHFDFYCISSLNVECSIYGKKSMKTVYLNWSLKCSQANITINMLKIRWQEK